MVSPPPPTRTPTNSPPPPADGPPHSSSSPPPKPSSPPPSSPPPPSFDPPPSPPPPPPTNPPHGSPPPPSPTPPTSSPPPPNPPKSAPPPPLPPKPPESSRSPPSFEPPKSSSSPPSPKPPEGSPPSPTSDPPPNSPPSQVLGPPSNSPPSQVWGPPSNSPPPPIPTTPPSGSPPSPGSPPISSSTPPVAQLSQPTSLGSQPPPSFIPPDAPTTNMPITNALDSANSTSKGGIGTGETVAIGLVLGSILIGIILTAVWCLWKRKKNVSGRNAGSIMPTSQVSSPKSDSALLKVQEPAANAKSGSGCDFGSSSSKHGGLGNSKSLFTYEELAEATNGFSAQNLLGEGGFGSVYKGCLSDGREVAVKQLKVGGGQGDREFRAEVEIISRVHHRHLVSLVGYCISEERRLLIYDYVPNNTLHFHLHGEDRPVLDWAARVKIAVGAARGIAYLHEDCTVLGHPRIIHRDIKSSNILLGNNFEAQVSDFGLARLFLDTNTHVTTRVVGTFGYMAPEYASSGKLTQKSDVFSFGVVLLELITGRKPVDTSQPLGEESLVEWARPLLIHALDTEEFEAVVDPRLEKNYVDSEMCQMIEAAAACVRHSSAKRPRMALIVRAFDGMSTTDLTNGMKVGESDMYNPAQQSAEMRLLKLMAFGSKDFSTDFESQASWNSEER